MMRRLVSPFTAQCADISRSSSVVERLAENQRDGGSNPSSCTNVLYVSFPQQQALLSRLVVSSSGCHEWQGARAGYEKQYGHMRIGSRRDGTSRVVQVHRVRFWLEHGWLPDLLRHTCDNGICCNPEHLVPGTDASNAADRSLRKRQNRKLEELDVIEIRKLLPYNSNVSIAPIFGISHQAVAAIRNGKTWRHI